MAIACVYCGASHDLPADVRACWQRAQQAGPPPAPSPPSTTAVIPAAPAVTRSTNRRAHPGPLELGRNLVVLPGAPVPEPWRDAPVVEIDEAVLTHPEAVIARLRVLAARRERAVFVLRTGFGAEPPRQRDDRPLHLLGPRYELELDALHHLVWANSVDATGAEPRWSPTDAALALGASPTTGPGDVVLPDGRAAWIDAGPLLHHGELDGAVVVPLVNLRHGRLTPFGPNEVAPSAAELAPDQHAAVTHRGGAARIIAPAGSGKTRVLTERARHLVSRWGLAPSAVCLVAFNTRAQAEMRDRTTDVAGLQVRTLNSLALAIVNGTAPFARRERTRRTIDEGEVRRLLDRLVAVPKKRNTDPLSPWIDALSTARLGLMDPAEVDDRYDGDVSGFPAIFEAYRGHLARDGLLDFDEQIVAAVELLLTDPAARETARRACGVLLVDEFQDLAPAHLLLVRLLAGPRLEVFGVGDDDQTIYGYSGADPAWLIDFATLFPGAGDHPLEVNYRCPEGIVTAADRLLRRNRRRVPKTIRAARTGEQGWEAVHADDTLSATVEAVTRAVAEGTPAGDIAVLTRVNALLAPVQVALAGQLPLTGGVGPEFVERTAVRATLAWLRLAAGGWRSADLAEALRRPSRPLHPNVVTWVTETRSPAALAKLAERLRTPRDAERVTSFAADIERLRRLVATRARTAHVLRVLYDDVGLAGSVAALDTNRHGMNRAAQDDDLVALAQLATLQPDPAAFPAWLAERLATRPGADGDGVTLATVHRVKGQEWPCVVVHEAAATEFPHRLADEVEEERRLLHVALTRASRRAVLVAPAATPSPFLAELSTEPTERELSSSLTPPVVVDHRRAAPAATTPLADKTRVIAVPGLVLVDQGQEWVVEVAVPGGAKARRGDAVRVFRTGTKVATVGGRSGALDTAGETDPDEASVRAYDGLRVLRRAAANGKPAYTVFDDSTLEAIALALPRDLQALARIKGVGPAKLERYGDAVLTVVEDAVAYGT